MENMKRFGIQCLRATHRETHVEIRIKQKLLERPYWLHAVCAGLC